jgi:hypothetical protein
VKLSKFHEICQQKWDNGRGDVQELYLRESSFDELWKDILVNRTRPVSILNASALLNPVTRSEVKIHTYGDLKDMVTVHYGGWKKSEKVDADGLHRA